MCVYEDISQELSKIWAMGGEIDEIWLASDLQEELNKDLGIEEPEGHLIIFRGYPVVTKEIGTGIKVIYH
jgi:hypothetical protein